MLERFSAIGSLDLWVLSSLRALTDSGFEYIKYDPNINELSGKLDGTLDIKFTPEEKNIVLEINSNSEKDIQIYKESVAKEYSVLQGIPEAELKNEYNELINKSTKEKLKKDWYKSEWFILLLSVLVPPVGIYLIYKFKPFKEKERKMVIGFFIIYTVLWVWLLTIPFFNRSTFDESTAALTEEETIEENPYAVNELTAYWSQQPVVDYTSQMPDLMTQYENLFANSQLGTTYGNQDAEQIFSQIKALDDSVLTVGITPEDNSAYTLSQKVAESANLFNSAIDENRAAINSGDPTQIDNAMNSWYNAENTFYEINYLYSQASQSANGEVVDSAQVVENAGE